MARSALFPPSTEWTGVSSADLRAAGLHVPPVAAGAIAGLVAGVPAGVLLQFGTEVLVLLGAFAGGLWSSGGSCTSS